MSKALLYVTVVLFVVGCGSETKPVITVDAMDLPQAQETVDGGKEICTPNCQDKQCGSDGCDDSCGTCAFQLETCTDEGQCIPTPCDSTKDCPGDLVCDKEAGNCVVCVGDEDCPEEQVCGADHECHEEFDCTSDIDCKSMNMVCDKDAGKCVECLGPEECPDEQFCLETYCVDDICTAGESHCDGLDVVTCNDEGSAEEVTETCTDTQYCDDGQCHAQVCPPGKLYCEENLLLTCDPIGKEVIDTADCEEDGKVCYQGECVEQECDPNSTWCHDDFTAAVCSENGMSSTVAPCESEHYCEDGACSPQVCDPGTVSCNGEVYQVCNDKGSAIQYEEDCAEKGQHCFAGACIDTECPPNENFCEDNFTKAVCANDGMSSTTEACPAEHFCDEGDAAVQCLPWICTPAEAFCEDNTAKVCNGKGNAVANEIACGDNVCVGGACKPVICAANTSYCDGNTVMQCDATGTVEQELEVCGDDQYCGEDGNAAACADLECVPNEKTCQGTKVMECDEVGAALVEFKDCADEGKGCVGGECVEQVCGNGALDPGEECDDGNGTMCDGCEGCSSLNYLYVPEQTGPYIEILDNPEKSLSLVGTPFTVEAWTRLDAEAETVQVYHRGNGNKGWAFGPKGDQIAVAAFSSVDHWTDVPLSGTGWRHIAWTVDAGQSKVWLDGKLLSEKSGVVVLPTTTTTIVGATANDNGGIKSWHHGRMDELRVSSVVRYADTFVPARRHTPDNHTVGLWHFDEGTGGSVVDSSSNAHVGNAYQVEWEPDDCYGTSPDAATCGDGQQAPWEECDDGNTVDGDGCSGECKGEQVPTTMGWTDPQTGACGGDIWETMAQIVAAMPTEPTTVEIVANMVAPMPGYGHWEATFEDTGCVRKWVQAIAEKDVISYNNWNPGVCEATSTEGEKFIFVCKSDQGSGRQIAIYPYGAPPGDYMKVYMLDREGWWCDLAGVNSRPGFPLETNNTNEWGTAGDSITFTWGL